MILRQQGIMKQQQNLPGAERLNFLKNM
jgi:hypothetical protein